MANSTGICALYQSMIGYQPTIMSESVTRQWLIVTTTFRDLFTDDLPGRIQAFLESDPSLIPAIQRNRQRVIFYNHEAGLILIYFLHAHKERLVRDWPLDITILKAIAANIGRPLDPERIETFDHRDLTTTR